MLDVFLHRMKQRSLEDMPTWKCKVSGNDWPSSLQSSADLPSWNKSKSVKRAQIRRLLRDRDASSREGED
jgi:hypothetical protein